MRPLSCPGQRYSYFRSKGDPGKPVSTIVTLTMNPALDACAEVDVVVPQHKLRCHSVRRDAGGGGINVARVVRRLGGNPLAIMPVGGPIGRMLVSELDREQVAHLAIPIAGDTREDWTIDEGSTGKQYRFVLPGPALTSAETASCLSAVRANAARAQYLVASGSLPPGVSSGFYRELATGLGDAKLVLDASGAALREALEGRVHLIKPSLRELEDLVGHPLPSRASQLAAARALCERGTTCYVALTLGAEGAILVGPDLALAATSPLVVPKSTVGAGDSFLGTLVWALAQSLPLADAFRLAVAGGAAALLAPGTELCQAADVRKLAGEVAIEPLQG
jgi:6-phosphofructokinase 2